MRNTHSDITLIVDASGSMAPLAAETVSGINNFIAKQQKEPGTATLTIVTFNSHATVRPAIDLAAAGKFDGYSPNGNTALLDAVGNAITAIGARLAALPEDERPGSVLVVIVTDGQENASREYKRDQIKQMIEHQTEQYKWTFLFLGSDVSAFAEAGSMGIGANFTAAYSASAAGVGSTYDIMSDKTKGLRSGRAAGASVNMAFTETERNELKK